MGTIKIILILLFQVIFLDSFASTITYQTRNFQVFEIKMIDEFDSSRISTKGDTFSSLSFKQIKTQRVDGLPELPIFTALLISPRAADGSDIKVEYSNEKQVFPGKVSYFKGEKCRCKTVEDKDFNAEEYFSEREMIKIESFGDFRGQKILRVVAQLGKQNKDTFEIFNKISLKIPNHYRTLKNFNAINDKAGNVYKTLILSRANFKKSLIEYVNSFEVGSRAFVHETIAPSISKAEIKAIIKKYYHSEKINSVILAGDDSQIPTYYVETKFDSQTPSDLNYGLMGESGDLIPDVFIARIPFQNLSQLENILSKWKLLNKGLKISNTVGVASNEGMNPSDYEYMRDIINPVANSKSAEALFLDQDSENSNKDVFNQSLENGVDFISYIGHGSGFSWPSFNREYDVEDLEEVEKQTAYPLVLDIACQNGRFSGEGRIGENLILGGKDSRAIGASLYYGGSVDISWHPPAVMTVGISQFISNNKKVRVSDALLYGHLYLINSEASKDEVSDNLEWYHLQGDPGIIIL